MADRKHPALVAHHENLGLQTRIADVITAFSGSMPFVYIHAIIFAAWILSGIEAFPYGLLTMVVSLEAIFLSTFVMISQNRADAKRSALAEHQWEIIQLEKTQNEELLELIKNDLALTEEIHAHTAREKS